MPFAKGNKLAVGRTTPAPERWLTKILIQQLSEIGPTQRAKAHELIDELIRLALGYSYEREEGAAKNQPKKLVKTRDGDLSAITAILERVDGKVPTQVSFADGTKLQIENVHHIIIDPKDSSNKAKMITVERVADGDARATIRE